LTAGTTYTLSFNSLAPYYLDQFGVTQVDDRTTLLDDIVLTSEPSPAPVVPEAGLAILLPASARFRALGAAFVLRRRGDGAVAAV
jgi:hypothetical protein